MSRQATIWCRTLTSHSSAEAGLYGLDLFDQLGVRQLSLRRLVLALVVVATRETSSQ